MTGRLAGKVVLVTGAARGQGRAHAVRFAEEGADVIAVDACADIPGRNYLSATQEDLDETARQVRASGRRAVTSRADVRDAVGLRDAVDAGVGQLGRLDVVCANAGVGSRPFRSHEMPDDEWQLLLDVNLTGVWQTCKAAVPHILAGGQGGSVLLTGSVGSVRGYQNIGAYVAAKHAVVGLMRTLAAELGPHSVRVNVVLPTQVDTPMIMNEKSWQLFRPDLESPTREDFAATSQSMHVLPVPWIEPVDVSNALLFLASDEARYITGVVLPVDCGALVK